jgi:hypothetical protein
MDERELRGWIARVKDGTSPAVSSPGPWWVLGLTAPVAAQMLASSGVRVAQAQTKSGFTPTKRGGGGELKTLWWQAVSILNCHLAVGVKDNDGSGSSTSRWPVRSRRQPGAHPGRGGADPRQRRRGQGRMSVTWKLKKNVQWHDGKPSRPTTSCSPGSSRPTPRPPRPPQATTRTSSGSTRWTAIPSRSASRIRRRSGRSPSAARRASSFRSTCSSRSRARSLARRRPT